MKFKQYIKEYFIGENIVLPEGLNHSEFEKIANQRVVDYIGNTLKLQGEKYKTEIEDIYPYTDEDSSNFLSVSIEFTVNCNGIAEAATYDYPGSFEVDGGIEDSMFGDIRNKFCEIIEETLKSLHVEVKEPILFEDSDSKTIDEVYENSMDEMDDKYER